MGPGCQGNSPLRKELEPSVNQSPLPPHTSWEGSGAAGWTDHQWPMSGSIRAMEGSLHKNPKRVLRASFSSGMRASQITHLGWWSREGARNWCSQTGHGNFSPSPPPKLCPTHLSSCSWTIYFYNKLVVQWIKCSSEFCKLLQQINRAWGEGSWEALTYNQWVISKGE